MHAVGGFLHYVAWQVCGGMLVVSPTRDMIASLVVRYVGHGNLSGGACSMGWPGGGGGLKLTSQMQAAEGKEQGKTAVVETGHSCVC